MLIAIPLRFWENKLYVNIPYIKKIKPIFITFDNYSLLKKCDGLLLPGGYDINSKWYNSNIKCNNHSFYNDLLDFLLIRYAIINDIPILGICRGMQALNVYFNGSLKNIKGHYRKKHYIYLNDQKILVNSYHHQAINKIGDGLIIKAISNDNIIEIITHNQYKILGLEFHPELIDENFIINYFSKKLSQDVSLRYLDETPST